MSFHDCFTSRAARRRIQLLAVPALTTLAAVLSPVVALAQPSPKAKPGVRVIVIRPRGFEPARVTAVSGRVLLVVHNRSGLRQVLLRLDRDAGSRVREVQVPREKLNWREVLDLTPGKYALTEASHPKWLCQITVTAK